MSISSEELAKRKALRVSIRDKLLADVLLNDEEQYYFNHTSPRVRINLAKAVLPCFRLLEDVHLYKNNRNDIYNLAKYVQSFKMYGFYEACVLVRIMPDTMLLGFLFNKHFPIGVLLDNSFFVGKGLSLVRAKNSAIKGSRRVEAIEYTRKYLANNDHYSLTKTDVDSMSDEMILSISGITL